MDSPHRFELDAYATSVETRVVRTRPAGEGVQVLLADTVLYPGGGGQPPDAGRLDGHPVQALDRDPEGVWHTLAEAPEAEGVTVRLDWTRRFDHMQQHTAQHLLTAVALDRFGWETTAFHLGRDRCDVELDAAEVSEAALRELEEACAEHVRRARPVRVERVDPETWRRMDLRGRALPDDHRGDVRIVEIEGVDRTWCGGTHVASTAALETIGLIDTEPMRGGTRVHWLAGGRVRDALGRHESRCRALRARLGVPDEGLVEAVDDRTARLGEAARALDEAEARWVEALATGLLAGHDSVRALHLHGGRGSVLQALARRVQPELGDAAALLTLAEGDGGRFVVVSGPGCDVEAGEAGAEVAALLEGRGGGRGPFFQGRAGSLEARSRALTALQERARGR